MALEKKMRREVFFEYERDGAGRQATSILYPDDWKSSTDLNPGEEKEPLSGPF